MIYRAQFLPGIEQTSALGFGTTGLVAVTSDHERERMFARLLDAGVTHFDTAPYYGYGAAERMLGAVSRAKRQSISITTKFGIQPPRLLKSGLVNRVARQLLKQAPQVRAALAKRAQAATKQGAFSPEDARRSLDSSLQALGTTHVDLFLLHEPTYSDALRDDLIAFLQTQVSAGKIRAFGCGGDFKAMDQIAASTDQPHHYLQFEDSLLEPNLERLHVRTKAITYRSIATLPRLLRDRLQRDAALLRTWHESIGIDCARTSNLAKLLVLTALRRNQHGVVLFSSTQLANIEPILTEITRSSIGADTLDRFWEMARSTLSKRADDAAALP